MLKAHAYAHAWPYVTLMPTCRAKPRVDLGSWSVDESGQFLDPSYSSSSISSSMYTCQCVVSITYDHDMMCKMAKALFVYFIPSMLCGTVKSFKAYRTPIDVHLSTSSVDESSYVDVHLALTMTWCVQIGRILHNSSQVWKPLYENPYENSSPLIHLIDLSLCHRESGSLTLIIF